MEIVRLIFFSPVVWIYLALINMIGLIIFGMDKRKAIKGKWRIPEKTLLLVACFGGAVGAYLGMHLFHHKTNKPKFYITIPLLCILDIGILAAGFVWIG